MPCQNHRFSVAVAREVSDVRFDPLLRKNLLGLNGFTCYVTLLTTPELLCRQLSLQSSQGSGHERFVLVFLFVYVVLFNLLLASERTEDLLLDLLAPQSDIIRQVQGEHTLGLPESAGQVCNHPVW